MKCLDPSDSLTPLGSILARLPIEPRLGKMLILGCLLGVGDALCTIAAQAGTSTDFFITDNTRGWLSYQQRNFAGNKHSDHLAALHAFLMWDDVRGRGENAESAFCEAKGLNGQTLRVTADAKQQLKQIMVNQGLVSYIIFFLALVILYFGVKFAQPLSTDAE